MTGTIETWFFVCMWRLGRVCVCEAQHQTSSSIVPPLPPPALFNLNQGFSLTWSQLFLLNWLASKPSGLASLCPNLSSTGVTIICCKFTFDVNARGPSLSHLSVCFFCTPEGMLSKPAVQTPTLWALLTCKSPHTNTRNLGMEGAAIANPQNGKREFFKSYI